tara:strand:+ start:221 stop:1003 length:783 start_codon:yes stop_codon:yes gene_type:complete
MKLKMYIFRIYLFIVHILKIDVVVDSKISEIKKKLLKEIATDKKKKILSFYESLKKSNQVIETIDLGKGSTVTHLRKRKVCDIAKNSSVSKKIGRIIHNLSKFNDAKNILEIGTSLGVSTVYLSTAISCSKVTTLEGCENTSNIALSNFTRFSLDNINLIKGNFSFTLDEVLKKTESFDLIFFDGNHSKIDTLNYFNKCLKKINSKSIFIFDDINWSIEMKSAWNQIIKNDMVTLSFSFFRVGVLFFKKDLKNKNYNFLE